MHHTTKHKYHQLLYAIFYEYSTDYSHHMYNKLFNACFALADCICEMEADEYFDEYKLRDITDVYVVKDICTYVDEFNDDDEAMQVLNACFESGRLAAAIYAAERYFKTKQGLIDMVKNPNFKINFERLLAYVKPS